MLRKFYIKFTLLLLMVCTPVIAHQIPKPLTQLSLVGSGKMSYLFWDIYIVKLYTPSGSYSDDHTITALEFTYLRDIKAEELVNETRKQWRKLNLDQHQEETNWLQQLLTLWPDISESDQLVFYVNKHGHAEFYYNGKITGILESPEFSQRFKNIWLSNKTTAPDVRRKLIGN